MKTGGEPPAEGRMAEGPSRKTQAGLLVAVVALASALAIAAYASHTLRSLERKSIDTRFLIRGDRAAPADLAIVAIDDKTFNDFRNFQSTHPGFRVAWPLPRCLHARVLHRIAAGRPKVIAVDLQFTERTTEVCDGALIQAVSDARPVILGTTLVDDRGRTNVFGGLPLEQLGAAAASTLMRADYGGVLRRVPYAVDGLTTLGVAAAAVAQGLPVPEPRSGDRWIDYTGGPGSVETYSYSDVYFGKVPPSAFRGRAVVLGTTTVALQDVHVTSVSGDPSNLMSGPEVQANVIETALHGFPLRTTPAWLNVLLIVLLAAIPAAASLRLGPLWVLLLGVGVGVLFAAVVQLAFDHDRIVLLAYPLIALGLSTLGSVVVSYETALRARVA
jgi:CHASE2 domain-containing sensor protein